MNERLKTEQFLTQQFVWPAPAHPIVGSREGAQQHVGQAGGGRRITNVQLKKIFHGASQSILTSVAAELNRDLRTYGLDTGLRTAHFFAQIREESGSDFEAKVERLNYPPQNLKSTFSYYRHHPDEAVSDGRIGAPAPKKQRHAADEQEIANKVYAGRNGNGDEESGDGWLYRGRGLIQVTGRANYAAMARQYRVLYTDEAVNFENQPELMAEFPYSVRSAVCFWVEHKLHKLADRGTRPADVDRITAIVNVSTDSYEKRRHHFEVAYRAFS